MNAEYELARQWVAKASNDLLNADNNLNAAAANIQKWLQKVISEIFPEEMQQHPQETSLSP